MKLSNLLRFRFLTLGLLLLGVLTFNSGCVDDTSIEDVLELRVRKNVKDLSSEEKQDLVDAILKLKATASPFTDSLTYYDQLVAFHQMAVIYVRNTGNAAAHHNPAFPPWHRKLLLIYEDALRSVSGKDITLPYWDWTDPASTSAVFTHDFMGPGGERSAGYAVLEGPFRKDVWQLNLLPSDSLQRVQSPHRYLVRGLGDGSANPYPVILPTAPEVASCLNVQNYDAADWNLHVPRANSFRNYLEGFDPSRPNNQFLHNIVHDWVAGVFYFEGQTFIGSMEPLDVSPNDPVFFLHHANVDRIFSQWENRYPDEPYQPTSGGPLGSNVNDKMYPYSLWESNPLMQVHGITPGSMMKTEAQGYVYE